MICEPAFKAMVTCIEASIYCEQAFSTWAFTRLPRLIIPHNSAVLHSIMLSKSCLHSHPFFSTELTSALQIARAEGKSHKARMPDVRMPRN